MARELNAKKVPFVMASGHEDEGRPESFAQAPALSKPIETAQFTKPLKTLDVAAKDLRNKALARQNSSLYTRDH